MLVKRNSLEKNVSEMGCCCCFWFGFLRRTRPTRSLGNNSLATSRQPLLYEDEEEEEEEEEEGSYNGDATDTGDVTDTGNEDENEFRSPVKRSVEILKQRIANGMICREIPVKETHELIRTEDEDGNRMVNQYIREYRIGAGSYGKVVLYRNRDDGKHYAIKAFHKSHLSKLRVAPSETAMSDVLRENIVHGDIKPDNLLVTASGKLKIGDFSVSQVFEDDNDELRRSPGTPVFTAPECCMGLTYRGRAADTWAVGVTLYCMVFGNYPFLGDTLQDTYDKIVNNSLHIPDGLNPLLKDLIEGLLRKDPAHRMTLEAVAEHPWFIGEEGPLPMYLCWCKRDRSLSKDSESIDTES